MSRCRRRWSLGVLVVGLSLLTPSTGRTQSPLETCQDQLRGVRVYAERLGKSKQAEDLDAAQTIAALIKQVEALRAELEQAKQQLQERSKAAGDKKE